jgi:hypothetical protein
VRGASVITGSVSVSVDTITASKNATIKVYTDSATPGTYTIYLVVNNTVVVPVTFVVVLDTV